LRAPKKKKTDYRNKLVAPANRTRIVEQVRTIAEPLCAAEGMELVHVEFQREPGGRILRLYVDKPGRVRLDDCVTISRQLGDLLDVSLETSEPYSLEVSSPGIDRPLGKITDYERFKGCEARIKTAKAIDGKKSFKGLLMGLSEATVILRVADRDLVIPYGEITRARLVNYNGEC
jgi:ribosome maturation factor RimP